MTTNDAALAALSASIGSVILPAPSPIVKDFGLAPDTLDPDTQRYLNGLGSAVRELAGNLGDPNNRAVRIADLIAKGFAKPITLLPAIGSTPGPPGVGVPGPPGPAYVPDSTLPPTVTGLTATAGLTTVIIQWTGAVYTQGHGPRQTNIYAVRKAAADPTLPTFPGAAGLCVAAPHALNIIDVASDVNIRWHIWATFVTNDGYESAAPAGGTNGFIVQTGKIGNTDLGDLIVTAEKLSAGTYPNINLVPNPGAEDDLGGVPVAWSTAVDTAGSVIFVGDTATKTGGKQAFRMTKPVAGDRRGAGCLAFPVIPGETYAWRLKIGGSANVGTGTYVRMYERINKPASGYCTSAAGLDPNDSSTDVYSNGAITTTFVQLSGTYVVPANRYWVTLVVLNNTGCTNLDLWWDDVSVGRQITAEFFAANSIAVGTAAIQNLALVNGMFANATIDSAKIASLDASKLTVGTGVIGGDLKSTNYVAGTSGWIVRPSGFAEFSAAVIRDQLVAAQIDTRGLSIKDVAGNVIFASGNSLDFNTRFLGSGLVTTGVPANNATADISLVNAAGMTITGNSAVKTAGGGGGSWDASFNSRDSYTGGAFVSCMPGVIGRDFMFGLNTDPATSVSYTDIDYAIYVRGNGALGYYAYESGASVFGPIGTVAVTDVLAVTYDGQFVRYLKNGVAFYTRAAAPNLQLYADSSFADLGAAVTNVQFGPMTATPAVALIDGNGMTINGNAATKTGGVTSTWDSAFYSKDAYINGAFVTFAPQQNNRNIMVGLNTDPTLDHSYASIDYAWYATSGGTLDVYESGASAGLSLAYAAGDVLTVAYDGANVRYMQNGVVRRTLAVAAGLKLYADSSFAEIGAACSNIQFGPYGHPSAVSPTNQINSGNQSTYIASLNASVIVAGSIVTDKLTNNAVTDIVSSAPANGSQNIGGAFSGPPTAFDVNVATASYTNSTGVSVTVTVQWSVSAHATAGPSTGWTPGSWVLNGSGSGWPGSRVIVGIPVTSDGQYSGNFIATVANGGTLNVQLAIHNFCGGSGLNPQQTIVFQDAFLVMQAVKK